MEEEGNKGQLIVGIVAAVIIVVILFFVLRGLFTKKTNMTHSQAAAPTSMQYPQHPVSPTPTLVGPTQGYYYNSIPQGSANQSQGSQSQSQSGIHQFQTQTLPNGMIQSQSQ